MKPRTPSVPYGSGSGPADRAYIAAYSIAVDELYHNPERAAYLMAIQPAKAAFERAAKPARKAMRKVFDAIRVEYNKVSKTAKNSKGCNFNRPALEDRNRKREAARKVYFETVADAKATYAKARSVIRKRTGLEFAQTAVKEPTDAKRAKFNAAIKAAKAACRKGRENERKDAIVGFDYPAERQKARR